MVMEANRCHEQMFFLHVHNKLFCYFAVCFFVVNPTNHFPSCIIKKGWILISYASCGGVQQSIATERVCVSVD